MGREVPGRCKNPAGGRDSVARLLKGGCKENGRDAGDENRDVRGTVMLLSMPVVEVAFRSPSSGASGT